MGLWVRRCSLLYPSACLQSWDAVEPGDQNFPSTIYFFPPLVFPFLYALVFIFLFLITLHPLTPHLFSLFPSHSVHREWCLGQSCDFLSEHNCRCLPLDDFFEKALVSRVTGNGGTTSLFLCSCPPPPCVALSLSLCVSLSLPQAVVDQVAGEHDTHTRQWQGCFALPLLPLLLFHQANSHRNNLSAAGEWNKWF